MGDDAHPVAMASGMLIGMGLGFAICAGTLAWQNVAVTLCALAAGEAGQPAVACPPPVIADPLVFSRF